MEALQKVGMEEGVLVAAISRAAEAAESAKSAHHRLDRMNGSIDRLGTAVIELRADVTARLDAMVVQQATEAGVSKGRGDILTPFRVLMLTLAASALSAAISHFFG